MALNFVTIEIPDQRRAEDYPKGVILEFMWWLKGFFIEVDRAVHEDENFRSFFLPGFPDRIRPSLDDFSGSEIFHSAYNYIESSEDYFVQIEMHGLWGSQLIWKMWNIKNWLDRFIEKEVFPFFDYLLKSINALLKSVLDGVPGGGGIIEFKEAIENSLDPTNSYDLD